MLHTMASTNQSDKEKLSSELLSAKDQVYELQERISRMEMLFLQHATGVAPDRLSLEKMRSISGAQSGISLLIYMCNFHVLSHLLFIYICKLHWNLNTMFVCQVNYL